MLHHTCMLIQKSRLKLTYRFSSNQELGWSHILKLLLTALKYGDYKLLPLALKFEHSPFCPRGVFCMFLTTDSYYFPKHQ